MNLQFRQVIVAYIIAALVVNPAMAQQQSANLMKQRDMRTSIEKLSVDRQAAIAATIELATTGNSSDPELKQALNGTTVVDIATPSAKGVSKNNWNEFSVGEEGIIFNNSKGPVLTQLGGWTDGNRRLAGGEASIILNQVNGSNRSSLLGAVEVAGKSAEFILANPNGITCNGCGFINTPGVSLITGQSRFSDNGDLTFDISGGDFLLEGKGLNATNIDRFDIVSRYAKINADLYAKNLNVMTGVNEFNYHTKALNAQQTSNSDNIQFAFDTSALGGMYANTIRLVGTEKGLGVNLQGIVQSTQDLEITADGDLQIKQLQANNQLTVKSISGNVNADEFIYGTSLNISAANKITNNGFIGAKNQIDLSANVIEQNADLYAGLDETNKLNATGQLNLTANQLLINKGDLYVGGALNLNTPELDNQGVLLLQTAENLKVGKILNSNYIQLNAENATIDVNSLVNDGNLLHYGAGLFTSALTGNLDNTGVIGSNGNVKLQALDFNNPGQFFSKNATFTVANFNNKDGQLETSGLTLNAQNLVNTGGMLLSLGNTTTSVDINVTGNFENQQGVFYTDTGAFSVTAKNLDNSEGNFIVNNAASGKVTIHDQLNNQKGFFQSNELSQVNAVTLDNSQGSMLASSLDGTFTNLNNNSGFIQANKLGLQGNSLDNTNGVILAGGTTSSPLLLNFETQLLNQNNAVIRNLNGDIQLTNSNFINNGGLVDASKNGGVTISAPSLNNESGLIIAKNTVQFAGADVNNIEGYIDAGNVEFALTGDLDNTKGVVQGGLDITARNLTNNEGYLLANKNSTIDLVQKLENQQGVVATQGKGVEKFDITANRLENTGDIFFEATNASITTTEALENSGTISATKQLDITAADLLNDDGIIDASELSLTVDDQITNESSQISGQKINISTKTLLNDINSLIYANALAANATDTENTLVIKSDLLDNKGSLVADRIDLRGNQFVNTGKLLSATNNTDSLVMNFLTSINNSGQISRNTNWSVVTGELVNTGRIESGGNGEITAEKIINNDVQKIATSADVSEMDFSKDNGVIYADKLALNSSSINNRYGILVSAGEEADAFGINDGATLINESGFIQFKASSASFDQLLLNNKYGSIFHLGNGTFNLDVAGSLDNSGGSITSAGDMFLMLKNPNAVLNNDAGLVLAEKTLEINATNKIDNLNKGAISGATLTLTSTTINNDGGVIEANVDDEALLNLNAQVNNINAGQIRSAAKNWNMVLDAINNDGGNLIHTGSGTFSVESKGNFVNKGILDSNGQLSVKVAQLQNEGQLSAADQISITSENGIVNSATGVIASNKTDGNFTTQLNASNQQINNHGYWQFGNLTTDSTTSGSEFTNSGTWLIGQLDSSTGLLLDSLVNTGNMVFDSSGKLTVDVNNKIVNSGQIISDNGNVTLNINGAVASESGFKNDGTIQTKQLQINASGNHAFTNTKTIATDSLGIGDNETGSGFVINNSGVIQTTDFGIKADQFTNEGRLVALDQTKTSQLTLNKQLDNKNSIATNSTNLSINAEQINNSGRIESLGDLELNATQLINIDQQRATTNAPVSNDEIANGKGVVIANNLSIIADKVENQTGILISQSNTDNGMSLVSKNSAPLIFNNDKGFVQTSANNLTIGNLQLTNKGGAFLHLGTGIFNLDLSGNLDNTGGTVNSAGKLILKLADANSEINNSAGRLSANDLEITTTSKIDNLNGGLISGANLTVTSNTLNNDGGVIEARGSDEANSAELSLLAQVNNINQGQIRSGATDWNMVLDSINNQGGSLVHTGSGTFTVESSGNFVNKGTLDSANHLSLQVAQLQNEGQLSAGSKLSITSTNGITNTGNIGSSKPDADFTTVLNAANQQINNQGFWSMGNQIEGSTAGSDFVNSGQLIVGDGKQNTDTGIALNSLVNAGVISYNNSGTFTVNANKIENNPSVDGEGVNISAVNGGLKFNLTGAEGLTNNSGISANRIEVTSTNSANAFVNNGRLQTSQFNLSGTNLTNSGILYGVENAIFNLTGVAITNKGIWVNEATDWTLDANLSGDGQIFHQGTGKFSLALANGSDLSGAYLETKGTAVLTGSIKGGETASVDADGSPVTRRTTVSAENMTIEGSTPFTNNGANLIGNKNITVNTSLVNQANSLVYAKEKLNVEALAGSPAIDVINRGTLQAANLSMVADTLDNTGGTINLHSTADTAQLNTIDLSNQLINTNGTIVVSNLGKNDAALDSLTINAFQNLDNRGGWIAVQNEFLNQSNTWESQPGTNKLHINASSWVTDANSLITSSGHLDLLAKGPTTYVFKNNGQVQSLGNLLIDAYGVENAGSIETVGNESQIKSYAFDNTGKIVAFNDLTIFAQIFDNASADTTTPSIQSMKNLTLDLQTLPLSSLGQLDAGELLKLKVNSDITLNAGDKLIASGNLSLVTTGQLSNAGEINSANQLLIDANILYNQEIGKIISGAGTSEFNTKNSIMNEGLISSKGDLNINSYIFANAITGRAVTGGNLVFDMTPNWTYSGSASESMFVNMGGVIYSNGNLDIKDAKRLENADGGELIAVGDMNLSGGRLLNNYSRIETRNGNMVLNFEGDIRNYSPVPTYTDAVLVPAQGGTVLISSAQWGSANFDIDEFKEIRERKANEDEQAVIYSGGNLTLDSSANIVNERSNIYAANQLNINGNDLINTPANGDSTVRREYGYSSGSAGRDQVWLTMNRSSYTESVDVKSNFGFIRAGGDITGTLSGKVVNTTTAKASTSGSHDPLDANAGKTFSDELKDYLDKLLPDSVKDNFYTDDENTVVDAESVTGKSSTTLDSSAPGSSGNPVDVLSSTVNATGESFDVDTLTGKNLQDVIDVEGSNGSGLTDQTANFTGATGDKDSASTDLLDQAGEKLAEANGEVANLTDKAKEEEHKTNQWPLISFDVVPFTFNLNNLSGLYVVSKNPDSNFLIETRPEFTEFGKFLGSDYLLDALGYDADKTIKRLGDAFFENQIIRDALIRETNSVYLGDATTDYEVMQDLMDNAVATASKLQLTIGVALTAEQSAALTQDMMWLVKKKINGQEVLVPHLYLTSVSPEKIAASKSAMAANGNLLLAANSIKNESSIQANSLTLVTRGNLQQDGRLFAQGDIRLLAGGQFNNNGNIQSNNLYAMADGNVTNSASGKIVTQNNLWLESLAGNTTNKGNLNTNNLTLKAKVDVEQTGNLQAKNNLSLIAGQDVLLRAKEIRTDANNVTHSVSNLTAGGNLNLEAGRNIELEGSDLKAGGNVVARAGQDINLEAMKNETHSEYHAKRVKVIDHSVKHDLVNIQGSNVVIDAGRDANLTGTNISAADNVWLSAERDFNMLAVVDSDYHFDQKTKKKSFGRKKTTTNETLTETVKGGLVMSGGDVMINAHRNENGEIITEKSGKVNLLGTNIMSGVNEAGEVVNENADVIIAADEEVNISGITTNSLDFHQTKKKSFGGLKKTDKGTAALDQLMENAAVSAGGDVHIISNNNLNLIAADVSANGDINLEAVDQLLITAGEVKSQTQSWKNSSGLFTNDSIYSKKEYKDGKAIVAGQASNIEAQGNVNITTGSGKIVGSNLVSGEDVFALANTGDLTVTTYQSTMESYKHEKEVTVGLGDIGKNLSRPDQWVQNKDGRATIKFADATYDEIDTKTHILDNQKSTINANGDITLIANAGKVGITGSDVTANADKQNGGNVNLAGALGVDIGSATNTQETQTKETHGSAEMSVVVQHQAVEVAKAVVALEEAEDKLKDAKNQYKEYKNNLTELERQLDQMESDVKNKVPGVTMEDLLEMRAFVEDVKGDEDFMEAGVALAAVNVATATTAVIQQTAAAAASTGTWGFNAGVQLDIDAEQNKNTEKYTTAQASNVSANQIRIQTGTVDANGKLQTEGTSVNVTGSNLIATQHADDNCENCESKIQIRTGDLNLKSSTDTTETSNENKKGHITAQMTVYGAAGGASVSGSYSQNKSTTRSTTHNNSQLNADQIELATSGDLTIAGANVDANKHLEVDVQGDMTVESKQNRISSRTAGASISGGVGFGGDNTNNTGNAITRNVQGSGDLGSLASANGGVGVSNGSSNERTTVLTTLTSGGTANINVAGHTQNTGALIATRDKEGNDLGNLNFTTGSYDAADLKNTSHNSQTNLNLSANVSLQGNQSNPRENQTTAESADGKPLVAGVGNISGAGTDQVLTRENSLGKTMATVGHGNITVGGVQLEKDGELTLAGQASDSPLITGNRNTQGTDKTLMDSQYNLSINASIDTRLLTESGRDAIAADVKTSKDFGSDIWNTGAQILENDNLNALHYMSTLDANAKTTQVINEIAKNEQLVAALKSDDPKTQAAAQDQVARIAQEKFGLTEKEIAELNFYDGVKTTSTSLAYVEGFSEKMGGVVVDKNSEMAGTIHIMANDKENMLNTVGQEILEKVTYENGSSNNAAQEARTEIVGDRLASGINKAVGGSLNATSGTNFVSDFKNSDLVIAGTERANAVGNAQVDNRQLETEELKFIKQQAPIYAARHEGMTEEEARGILTKQALSMVDARWKKRLSEEGFTGDPDAEAFLKKQAGPQVVTLVRKDGTHTQGMLTSTDEQFQDFYYNSYQSYMAEKGILDNPAYHATYNPVPHLIDDEFKGWLNQYAMDGKVTDLDANFIAENKKDSSEIWNQSSKLIDEKGWSVIPYVGGKLVDSVGEAVDTCKKGGLNCFIPTSKIEGDGFEKAYMDKLVGDQEHYSDNLSKGFWDVGLTAVAPLGVVSIPKKAGQGVLREVVDIVNDNSTPKNYHEILNVAEDASPAEIKNAYRRAASENHPDRNPDPQATTKMQEINEAYEALSGKSKSPTTKVADNDSPVKGNSNSASPTTTVKRNSDSEIVVNGAVKVTESPVDRIDNKNTIPSSPSNNTAMLGNTLATSAMVVSANNTVNHAKNAEALLNNSRNNLVNSNSGGVSNRIDNFLPGALPKTETRDLDYADAPERNLLDEVLAGTNQSSTRTLDDLIRNTERANTSSPLDDAINQNRLLDERDRLLAQLNEMDKNPPAAGVLSQSIAETERNALLNRIADIEQLVKGPDVTSSTQIGKVVDVNKPEVINAANDIIKPEIKVVRQANGPDIYLSNDKNIPGSHEIGIGSAGTNSPVNRPGVSIQTPVVQRPTINPEGKKPVAAPANIQVPENVWPQPYPPLPEGATRIAEIERIKTNQVTGAFQGEVKESIVDRKVAEIQAILNGAPGAAKELPVVRMAPDPVNPNGLVLTDQTHTYAAYVKLGFDEIPASVYNETNGVPFLIKQHAYNTDNYAPINELRNVPEFTGTPAQQAAKRRAELESQKNKEAVNNAGDKTAGQTVDKQPEILPNELNNSASNNAANNKITSPTEDMLKDPYHPDWKRYDGPEKQSIGADKTREAPSAPVIGAEGKQVSSLSRDTKLVRYEPKNASTPMQPHESDYFDVSKAMEYGLKPDNYNALFVVTADRLEELTKLREKQGYFDQDVVLRETTLGELMDEFPNASVLEDYRFNGTLLGADSEGKIQQGSYIIVTKKDQTLSQAENKTTDTLENKADVDESASNIPDSFWNELEAEHAEFIPGPYIDPAGNPEKQTRSVKGRITDLMISPDHKNADFVEGINELVASTPTKAKRHIEFVRNGEKFEGVYDGLDQNGQLNFILANNERLVVNLEADDLAIERMPIYLRSSEKLLIDPSLHPEAAALIERIHNLPVGATETKYVRLTTQSPDGIKTIEGSYDNHDARGNLTLLNIEKINQGEFGSEAVSDVNLINEKIINAEVLIMNHETNTLRSLDVENKPGFFKSIKNFFTGKSGNDDSTDKLIKPSQAMLDNPYHPDWKRYDGPEKQSIGASKVGGPNDSNPGNPDSIGLTDAMREAGWLDVYNPSKGPEHYKHLDAKFHNDPYGSVYITESAQRESRQLNEILDAIKARTGPVIDTNVPYPDKSFREIIEKEKNSQVSSTLMSNPALMNEIESRLGKDRQFGFAGAGHSAIALSFIDANGQKQILRITDKTPNESMPESPYISPIKGEVTFENIRLQITEPVAVLGDFMEDGHESIKVHQYIHAALYRDGILFDDGHEFNYGMTRDGRLVVIDLDAVTPINTIKQMIDEGEITYNDSRAFYETLMNSMEKESKLLPEDRRQPMSTSKIDTDLLDEFIDKNSQANVSKKSHLNLVVNNTKEFDDKISASKDSTGQPDKEIYGRPISPGGNQYFFYFNDMGSEMRVADVTYNTHNDHLDMRYEEINEELHFGPKTGANNMAVVLEKSLAMRKRKPESISIVIDGFNNREFIESYRNAVVQFANTGISQEDLIAFAFNNTAVGQLAKSLGYKLDVHTMGIDREIYSEKGDIGYIQIPAKVIIRYEKADKPDLSYQLNPNRQWLATHLSDWKYVAVA